MTKRKRWGSVTRHRDGWRVRAQNAPGYGRESLGVFATHAEAEAIRQAAEEASKGTTPGMTLAAWGTRWLIERRTRWPRQEQSNWRAHVANSWIADRLVRRITRADIVRWIREVVAKRATVNGVQVDRFLSRQTAQHVLNLLRLCLSAAADEGIAQSNPALGVLLAPDVCPPCARATYALQSAEKRLLEACGVKS